MEDSDILRLLVGAHRGLLGVYNALIKVIEGDTALVTRLLRCDWRNASEALFKHARELLERVANSDSSTRVTACPSKADTKKVVDRMKSLGLPDFLCALNSVVNRCLVCIQLVPISSASAEVNDIFQRGLEAEDLHLAQLAWLKEMVEGGERA